MSEQDQIPPALKHGIYSGMTLLPGEDAVAFNKLHNELISEFTPVGPLEDDIVHTIARLTWRKQNLSTYRVATRASNRYSSIMEQSRPKIEFKGTRELFGFRDTRDPNEVRAAREAAFVQARKELGVAWELIGDVAKIDHLLSELSVVDRLDGMIDRCLKRLLFVRGLKSLSASTSSSKVPTQSRPKELGAA